MFLTLLLLYFRTDHILGISLYPDRNKRILAITIASELAAEREDVKGSGTFLAALIDELYNLTPEKIVDKARLEVHL